MFPSRQPHRVRPTVGAGSPRPRPPEKEQDALTAQLEAGDYRAFIEDEELWDAVRNDPEAAKYAAQTEYERQLKELNLKRAVVLAHQAQDDETRFYRSTADSRWLNLLYEREIALQQGDAARVQELNADMDAAGFERKWPEEVAAERELEAEMIAFQRERGDEETRDKLGYAADRELTDEDYLRAAEIGVSFWDFDLWHDSEAIQKVLSLRSDANLLEEIQENGIINGLFSFSEKAKAGYEERLDQAAEAIIGDGAGYSQVETTKDVLALGPAVIGGLSQGAFSLIDAIPYLASNLYYMVNKDRMGTEESWEQMRMDDGFFNMLCSISDFTSNVMDALDVDLSERAEWVKTTKSVSYTVGQNRAIYELSGAIADVFGTNLAHTVPQAEKLFTTVRFLTQDVGFWITGYKSSMQEALAEGATYEQAFWYGVVGASISTAVEHIDDLGGRYLGSPDSASKGLMKYFEGRGKNWELAGNLCSLSLIHI